MTLMYVARFGIHWIFWLVSYNCHSSANSSSFRRWNVYCVTQSKASDFYTTEKVAQNGQPFPFFRKRKWSSSYLLGVHLGMNGKCCPHRATFSLESTRLGRKRSEFFLFLLTTSVHNVSNPNSSLSDLIRESQSPTHSLRTGLPLVWEAISVIPMTLRLKFLNFVPRVGLVK
jgi:hypothetical protein